MCYGVAKGGCGWLEEGCRCLEGFYNLLNFGEGKQQYKRFTRQATSNGIVRQGRLAKQQGYTNSGKSQCGETNSKQ